MNADAAALLKRLGLEIDPRATLGTLNIALRQMVAIARGVSFGAKVVVLDEPTSSLTEHEVKILYEVIRRLKQEGAAVVYISHRFDELYEVCDRVTILRDGKLVGTRSLEGLEKLDLVCLMLGKRRDELRQGMTAFARQPTVPADAQPLMRAANLTRGRKLNHVTVEVGRGEIVGMAGLLGSGRTETARAIFAAPIQWIRGPFTLKAGHSRCALSTMQLRRASPFSPKTAKLRGSFLSYQCVRI